MESTIPPQPTEETDAAGVDLTLVRWMLSLSPEERLRVLQDTVNSLLSLRGDQT